MSSPVSVLDLNLEPVSLKNIDGYVSEILVSKDSKGKYRTWSFYVTCEEKLTPEHYTPSFKFSSTCYIHHVSGQVGGAKYPMDKQGKSFNGPKYEGKKNETNQFVRLIEMGNSEASKKMRQGYTKVEQADEEITYASINDDINKAPIPQQFKAKGEATFPCYASIKYDGVSLICCYQPAFTNHKDNILCYTRARKEAKGFNDIRAWLKETLKNYPGLFVVGEFYKHGLKRNEINSIHSRNVTGKLEEGGLDYYIFDCFYAINEGNVKAPEPDVYDMIDKYNSYVITKNKKYLGEEISKKEQMEFCEKFLYLVKNGENYLEDMINYLNDNVPLSLIYSDRQKLLNSLTLTGNLKLAESFKVEDEEELMSIYEQIKSDGYEGLIIHKDSTYMYSMKAKKINPNIFKLKPFCEDEFEIVNYKLGEGKASKNILMVLKTKDNKEFTVAMNYTDEEMADLYEKVNNDFSKFKGKMLTVKYEQLSPYGIPIQAKGLTIRTDL